MNGVFFAVLSAATACAGAPATVARVFDRIDALAAEEPGRDARAVAALDLRAAALFAEIAPLGWRAAAPLGAAARDRKRPAKSRFFAATFLSKLNDPAAFRPLSDVLLDPEQDADTRLSAAQGLAVLDVPPEAARKTFCAALGSPELPRPVLDEALIALTRLGCGSPAPLENVARLFGPRPAGPDLATVSRALTALARTRGEASLRRLLALVSYFPSESPARADAIGALEARTGDLTAALASEALPLLQAALRSETRAPATMLVLIRIVDAFGPAAAEVLLPLAAHADAAVLAAAAEALARRRETRALPVLESVVSGALSDPRFSPRPDGPAPARLLERVESAVAALRRAKAVRR